MTINAFNTPSNSLIDSLAGFLAGVASTIVAHPLDLIKTRLQVDRLSSSQFRSSVSVTKQIFVSNEGVFAALYRGLAPNLIGNSVSWALYFMWYNRFKTQLQRYHESSSELSYYDYFLASGAAGSLTAIATNPIWVIKTRILSTSVKNPRAYSSIGDGVQQIFRNEGLTGFYRGLVPSLFGVSHGAVQFMLYEKLKTCRSSRDEKTLSVYDFLIVSGLAKVLAGSLTYPYQVVRARLQMYDAEKTYSGARDVFAKIWKHEGIKGFYKGLGPNLLRVLPSTWITFLVYEKAKLVLSQLFREGGR